MNVDQFVEFLNKEQRDPRLNEILYPYANRSRALDLIEQYEPTKELAQKGAIGVASNDAACAKSGVSFRPVHRSILFRWLSALSDERRQRNSTTGKVRPQL